jgi:hypothetical protein
MHTGITRRSALGVVAGFGTVAGLVGIKGCGGGGSDSSTDGGSTGGGSGSGDTLPGSFWYQRADGTLNVVAGGTAQPVVVNKIMSLDSASAFSVARNGPRYLQRSHISEGLARDIKAVINVYDHSNHQAYCFINLDGYVASASVSPSGKYVVAFRSPEFSYSVFNQDSTLQLRIS